MTGREKWRLAWREQRAGTACTWMGNPDGLAYVRFWAERLHLVQHMGYRMSPANRALFRYFRVKRARAAIERVRPLLEDWTS